MLLCCLEILLVRAHGARVVWTIHNRLSHETTDPRMERRLRSILCRVVNQVIVHSQSALEVLIEDYGVPLRTRAVVIPHGNYDGCYPGPAARDRMPSLPSSDDGTINILFFGAVRPYKGVERLLQAVQIARTARINLVIAGRPATCELARAIGDAAEHDGRICPILRFIRNDEITTLFAWADVVALPFERTLTSGSAVLSLTLARPVLTSELTRVLDIVDETNAVFYTAENLDSVLLALDKYQLSAMRTSARRSADSLEWESIGRILLRAYNLDDRQISLGRARHFRGGPRN